MIFWFPIFTAPNLADAGFEITSQIPIYYWYQIVQGLCKDGPKISLVYIPSTFPVYLATKIEFSVTWN